jgi:plastocyanin
MKKLFTFLFTMTWLLSFLGTSAFAYEAIEVTNGGTITGTVKFAGEPPERPMIEPSKDKEVCKPHPANDLIVSKETKGIQYAVAYLADIQKGKPQEKPAENPKVDQKGCEYLPHVLIFPAGSTIDILNSDGILHNIHTFSQANPPINKAQPKFKKVLQEKVEYPEVINVKCDVHTWMNAYWVATGHPYYAATDENGNFKLENVPPGNYKLGIWHEKLGTVTQDVAVKEKEETKVTVEMAPK